MRIDEIIWLDSIVEKLAVKHRVQPEEVEEMLESSPRFRFVEKGDRDGENVYLALGQTYAGRYLVVFFIYKADCQALVLSARDMSDKERKQYGRK